MSILQIDPGKCRRDGICVAACPLRIIEMPDQEALPVPTADAAELCIDCGHCVAVCPHDALTHRSMAPEQCPPILKERILDPEKIGRFMRIRRSIRRCRCVMAASKGSGETTCGSLLPRCHVGRLSPISLPAIAAAKNT